MIIDTIDNLKYYVGLNPRIAKVLQFLEATDLSSLKDGSHPIDGDDVYVNVMHTSGKAPDEAVMESHRNMLDIQIPLSCDETYGYTPLQLLPEADYDAKRDLSFYPGIMAESLVTCHPGMMAIFMPDDGHQPCISMEPEIHKAVFKVRCRTNNNEKQ